MIDRDGPVYVISPRVGPCPNWQRDGCAVYDDRPRECRLFPFTLFVRKGGEGVVSLGYHCDTRCPMKGRLAMPKAEVVRLVAEFGQDAFGDRTEVRAERLFERLRRRAVALAYRAAGVLRVLRGRRTRPT